MIPPLFRQILRTINLDDDEPQASFHLNDLIPEDGRSAKDRAKDLAQRLFSINTWIRHPDGSESVVRFVSMVRRVPGSAPDNPDVVVYLDRGREALTYLRSYKDKLREEIDGDNWSRPESRSSPASQFPFSIPRPGFPIFISHFSILNPPQRAVNQDQEKQGKGEINREVARRVQKRSRHCYRIPLPHPVSL